MGTLRRNNGRAVRRRGLNAIEVIVVLAILALFAMLGVMILPRRRETARMASCQRNLMQIGVALALYDQGQRSLPTTPALGGATADEESGPLIALLVELGLPDLTELSDSKTRPPKQAGLTHEERRVPGFLCASDSRAFLGTFPAPVSYRATTGDAPDGRNGAFAPGRQVSIAEIEAGDGVGYTAAFSERLVGDGAPEHPAPWNYALVPGPLPAAGCPAAEAPSWRGDAGSSWVAGDWRSTLYNHALPPNAVRSCIADDHRSAFMGASSGHAGGVNVLIFDGSVRTFTPRVDAAIWHQWAAIPEVPHRTNEGSGPSPGPDPPRVP
jgi:prepilin-type N-terminal cleavage/methylation domain-containing protein/prepilin-type processing-associated H-X9-DG protein